MTRKLSCVLGLIAAFALVGCGQKGASTAKVTGKVTLPNGQPLPGGRIDFRAATGNMVSGQIKADGTYEAREVPPGEYKVSVENSHLKGISPPPPGLEPLPGSAVSAGEKYVAINARYMSPETSGFTTTVNGKTHSYDVALR
jgi:hypothetical protein